MERDSGIEDAWSTSVYYADIEVDLPIAQAWALLLRYEDWNPTFVGATVVPVRGQRGEEAELVLITKELLDVDGEPLPNFYAETVKVVPGQRIVWYVYPETGRQFANFVDFGLVAASGSKTIFAISYYAQESLRGETLERQRLTYQEMMEHSAAAFRDHCAAARADA